MLFSTNRVPHNHTRGIIVSHLPFVYEVKLHQFRIASGQNVRMIHLPLLQSLKIVKIKCLYKLLVNDGFELSENKKELSHQKTSFILFRD